jgi:predicted Zn-dependent protease
MKRALTGALVGASLVVAGCAALQGVADQTRLNPPHVSVDSVATQTAKLGKKFAQSVGDLTKNPTPENEYWVGRSVAANLLSRHERKIMDRPSIEAGKLTGLTAYVDRVGQVLVATAQATREDDDRPAPVAGWHFIVLDDASINGFAAPGGFIFVTRGAVQAAATEDELAAVLAHEVAHVVKGHALGTLKSAKWAALGKEAVDSLPVAKLTQMFDGSINDMIDSLTVKGYGRDTEFAADERGVHLLASAGYSPKAMTSYLARLKAQEAGKTGGYQSTHPSSADRIAKLQPAVDKLSKASQTQLADARTGRFTTETKIIR